MNAAVAVLLAVMNLPAPAADANDPVRVGLKWLAAQQKVDGSWDTLNNYPTAINATAGLALLMQGSTAKDGTYAPHIRKAVAWFEANASDDGMLGGRTESERYQPHYSHAQALLFVACAYDVDDDGDRRARLAKLLEKATALLIGRQSPGGGWGLGDRRDPGGFDRTDTTAIVLQALLAVRKAGVAVPTKVIAQGFQFLTRATNTANGKLVYATSGGVAPRGEEGLWTLSADAAATAFMHDGARPLVQSKWVTCASTHTPAQLQMLNQVRRHGSSVLSAQYEVARCAYSLGDNGHRKLDPDARPENLLRWSSYRDKLFPLLKAAQLDDGSWPDNNLGSAYITALTLIILQLKNGYLPAFAR